MSHDQESSVFIRLYRNTHEPRITNHLKDILEGVDVCVQYRFFPLNSAVSSEQGPVHDELILFYMFI